MMKFLLIAAVAFVAVSADPSKFRRLNEKINY